jgi:hypothetical protein
MFYGDFGDGWRRGKVLEWGVTGPMLLLEPIGNPLQIDENKWLVVVIV